MTRAIIFTPRTDYVESAARCLEYVERQGYEYKGLVQDWAVVHQMFERGETSVAIVADPRDLDPHRKPRVEFVSHSRGRQWEERTRIIRRNAAR